MRILPFLFARHSFKMHLIAICKADIRPGFGYIDAMSEPKHAHAHADRNVSGKYPEIKCGGEKNGFRVGVEKWVINPKK